MDTREETLLLRVHDSSGSVVTANSRRLRTLRNNPAALAQCQCDVEKDIAKYAHVSIETKARCVDAYAETADVKMFVCGACGLRDPFDKCEKEVEFSNIIGDHWLLVEQEAYTRLKDSPGMDLLRPCSIGVGGYEKVCVPRTDLHHIVKCGEHAYHAIEEAVTSDNEGKTPGIKLCKRCARGFSLDKVAKRINCSPEGSIDNYDDLYAENAPPFSIASGADFGRLNGLKSKGIRVDVSTLERLVLAEARCHQIVYKVIAYGDVTDRKRLKGHSIVCPQNAVAIDYSGFGKEALEAAFGEVRILFVGPNGMRQKLEDVALKIDDFRLRPDVIFNFLTINHMLHNGPPVPSMEEVSRLIAEHSFTAHLKQYARCVTDTTVDKKTSPSDVANVRYSAQSAEHINGIEEEQGNPVSDDETLPPFMSSFGLLEMQPQQIDAVIEGIHRVVIEGEGGNADDNNTSRPDVPIPVSNPRTLHLQREDNLLNDYQGAADVMYKTWWSLLPLRRGFVKGKSIPDAKWRQVMLYYDNRFAQDISLLFHAANMVMRHAVNRAVTATVKTAPGAFAKFQDLIIDKLFLAQLAEARENPKGVTARTVVKKVIGFINLSGSKVPWGTRERAAEMTKLIADHRYAGPSSIFYSVAPDDVHNPTAIRWASPYTGETTFPATISPEFVAALQGITPIERTALAADGTVSFAMDEASLQLLAAKNPIACAITFDHLVENVRTNLIGWSDGRLVDTLISAINPNKARPKGMCDLTLCVLIFRP